ncbi:MAG: Type II secretion system protein G precursor [bacterium ADurb.Bin478]|jgi:general secretion pathway protein G|nr:MAG: Type II secretion system protein G precursor [bacterium ADurb.Bin478]
MKTKRKRPNGFTLVEIMAVILILSLVIGIAAKNFIGMTDKARVTTTRATLKELHAAVNMFKLDTGRYPTEEEGLYALIEQPSDVVGWSGYLDTTDVPRDAWKNELVYMLNPESGRPFVIISYGADGKEGGEGYDMDLYSTDVE